jgi:hypothetical protein
MFSSVPDQKPISYIMADFTAHALDEFKDQTGEAMSGVTLCKFLSEQLGKYI